MVCDASIWICSLSGYIDTVNTQLLQQILAAFCIAGTNRSFSDKSTVNILVIRCIKIIIYVIYEIGVNVFYLFVFIWKVWNARKTGGSCRFNLLIPLFFFFSLIKIIGLYYYISALSFIKINFTFIITFRNDTNPPILYCYIFLFWNTSFAVFALLQCR